MTEEERQQAAFDRLVRRNRGEKVERPPGPSRLSARTQEALNRLKAIGK